jgi:hypothetical protein
MTALGALPATTVGCSNFSIFIVPFRYQLEPATPTGVEASFRQERLDWDNPRVRQRANYVIGETRELLFGRGKERCPQFDELKPEVAFYLLEPFLCLRWYRDSSDDRKEPFDMDAFARLVLFEDSAAAKYKPKKHQRAGHIGLLLLYVPAVETMSFADLLDLNEKLRLVRYQYEEQKRKLTERSPKSAADGMRRFAGFEMGPERSVPGGEDDPWRVGLWEALLRNPLVQQDGRTCRLLDVDLTVNPDERAFVASHACVSGVTWDTERSSRLWTLWHQLLYVDPGEAPRRGSLTSYEDEWARKRTYFRWGEDAGDSRLSGFSTYSFTSLCSPRACAPAALHFRDMYLDQLLLVLYQRVALFSFSRTLAALTQRWKMEGWASVRGAFAELRESFDQFVNLYWFPTFSNQVQSLEMYEVARRELDNRVLFEELRVEMESTWGFMEARNSETLNRGGAVVAVFALTLAYFGMSLFDPSTGVARLVSPSWSHVLILLGLLSSVWAAIEWWVKRGRGRGARWALVALISVTLISLLARLPWTAILAWITRDH